MASDRDQLNAEAGDLPKIDYAKQLADMQAALPQARNDMERQTLQGDITHVSGVNELLAMKPAGAGGDHVAELLALPKVADTSNPEGNKDARDRQMDMGANRAQAEDQSQIAPSWLQRAMNAVPAARGAQFLMSPQGRSTGRGLATGAGGAGGNFEQFLANDVPRMVGHGHPQSEDQTVLPTSQDMSRHLTQVGLPPDAYRQTAEHAGDTIGGLLSPALVGDIAIMRPLAKAVGKRVGAARALTEDATGAVGTAARERTAQLVDQTPMPVPREPVAPLQDVKPAYPGPRADEPVPVSPFMPKPPSRTPAANTSAELEQHIMENDARLGKAKSDVYEKYKAETPPAGIDLQDFKADLTTRIARAGTDEEATALRSVLNRVNTIEAESDTQFESLDKLRRQIGKKAAFGETPSGYEAIGKTQARDLNKALGERMKAEHPAYAEYTDAYSKLAKEGEPMGAAFLKAVGADEGGSNLIAKTLAEPKNVDMAIKAIGEGGAQKLDALALKHIQTALGRKSGQTLEDAVTDLLPSLEKLPQARAAALKVLRSNQLDEAHAGIVDNLLKTHGERNAGAARDFSAGVKGARAEADAINAQRLAQAKNQTGAALSEQKAGTQAAERAEQVASSYRANLNAMQTADITRQPKVLRTTVNQMLKDNLISDTEHRAFLEQIERANQATDKAKAFQTLSKYVAYTLTGNYMISFGGPHLVSYLQK